MEATPASANIAAAVVTKGMLRLFQMGLDLAAGHELLESSILVAYKG